MMIFIEEAIDVGKQAMKYRKIGVLAIVDLANEMFHAVEHRSEVLVLTLDNG
jgi:hypothetical protein